MITRLNWCAHHKNECIVISGRSTQAGLPLSASTNSPQTWWDQFSPLPTWGFRHSLMRKLKKNWQIENSIAQKECINSPCMFFSPPQILPPMFRDWDTATWRVTLHQSVIGIKWRPGSNRSQYTVVDDWSFYPFMVGKLSTCFGCALKSYFTCRSSKS